MSEAGSRSSTAAGPPETADAKCAEATAARGRRNVVLLSDGTGNSPAKLNKTNVWRLYQALDLGDDDQIALYDDGVWHVRLPGRSKFSAARFGWGLSRNVRDLYEFLCRHYTGTARVTHLHLRVQPRRVHRAHARSSDRQVRRPRLQQKKVPGGAATREIRLNTHAGLKAGVKLAYKSYRRGYSAPVARLTRWLRDLLLGPITGAGGVPARLQPRRHGSEFVGSGTRSMPSGLPIDEMTRGMWTRVWPRRLEQGARPAWRARVTPSPWTTNGTRSIRCCRTSQSGADANSRERITQVWFSGVHSNVGGGYPDDDLAHVSLRWMVEPGVRGPP